ncbi:MAG: hypothetical protein ACTSR0_04480 [Candidatus Asgardarchaeia archaeon]
MSVNGSDERGVGLIKIAEGYRISPSTQVFLYVILLVIGFYVVDTINLSLDTKVIVFTVYASLLFPIIIKVKGKWVSAITLGLYGAAIASIIYWTYVNFEIIGIEGMGLYVAFLEIMVIELLHHIDIEVVSRSKKGYALAVILGMVFFVSVSSFLITIDVMYLVYFGIPATVIFIYAILPEIKM